ncbi:hypothetical protein Tco_0786277 [Tanacetum coccineum]
MAKPMLNETQAEQNLAEPRAESNVRFEFSKELLTELQNNTFSGREKMVEERGRWKYYHLGRVGEEIFQEILPPIMSPIMINGDDDEEGRDPLEFIP